MKNNNRKESETRNLIRQLGLMGTPGYSVGGFLNSPFARDQNTPDLQFTLYSNVIFPLLFIIISNLMFSSLDQHVQTFLS